MSVVDHRPDTPDGSLIDDLVTDILDGAMRQVQVATETVARLDQYPQLRERYGEGGLRLVAQWAGPAGRVARADLHRALRDRGMSQRQIAAVTGVDQSTVARDLAPQGATDADASQSERARADNGLPPDADASPTHDAPRGARRHAPPDDRWRALDGVAKAIRDMRAAPAQEVAASVPEHRRAGTARTLRELGTYLGAIALALEEMTR